MKYFSILSLLFTLFLSGQEQSLSSKLDDLSNYLRTLEQQSVFSGAVLIAKNDDVLMKKAYGKASLTWNAPNTLETKFNLASMGKIFTATAIGMLVEDGSIDFEDKVGIYLKGLPNKKIREQVTIGQLLGHHSGIPDIFTQDFINSSKRKYKSVNDWDSLYISKDLNFEPGARFEYSNSNYLLLGKIIEHISGKSYEEYIAQVIFEPLGMKHSGYEEVDKIIPNLAEGYTTGEIGSQNNSNITLRRNILMHSIKGGPAGGGYSTVEDLFKFCRALVQGKLISKSLLDKMTSKYKTDDYYGYGFQLFDRFGEKSIGHSGGFPGINTIFEYYKDKGILVVALGNFDTSGLIVAERMSRIINNMDCVQPDFSIPSGLSEEVKLMSKTGPTAGQALSLVPKGRLLVLDGFYFVPKEKDNYFDVVFEETLLKIEREPSGKISQVIMKTPMESITFELVK